MKRPIPIYSSNEEGLEQNLNYFKTLGVLDANVFRNVWGVFRFISGNPYDFELYLNVEDPIFISKNGDPVIHTIDNSKRFPILIKKLGGAIESSTVWLPDSQACYEIFLRELEDGGYVQGDFSLEPRTFAPMDGGIDPIRYSRTFTNNGAEPRRIDLVQSPRMPLPKEIEKRSFVRQL